MNVERIKDWRGRVIGQLETKPNGDKVLKNFYGQILGFYWKSSDITTDFHGQRIGQGDVLMMLLH